MARTYSEWVHWLENRSIMPLVKPGLENTKKALRESGLLPLVQPQKVIHVAGTNGKGTTAKTLSELLRSEGKSVGLYTSPHLIDTCERININGKNISQNLFCELCEDHFLLIERLNLSHFEAITLFAADVFFRKHPVEYSIFEIGLGGTWDATNAIPHNTSVITTIGYDHMHILGNSLEEIADNKFGIIQKQNVVVHFTYPSQIESRLKKKICEMDAQSIAVPPALFSVNTSAPLPQYVLKTPWGEAHLSLMGQRAAENMSLALTTFTLLGFDGKRAPPVLQKISWPARMTEIKTALPCPVYLSGDHNIQGIESLREILSHAKYKNVYFILGLSKNRRHEEFIDHLTAVPRSRLLLTQPQFQGVRPLDTTYPFYETPQLALSALKTQVDADDLVVITGSLYLCGDVMKSS